MPLVNVITDFKNPLFVMEGNMMLCNVQICLFITCFWQKLKALFLKNYKKIRFYDTPLKFCGIID